MGAGGAKKVVADKGQSRKGSPPGGGRSGGTAALKAKEGKANSSEAMASVLASKLAPVKASWLCSTFCNSQKISLRISRRSFRIRLM